MKFFASFFSRLYTYSTVCIVIGSPLFFIPFTSFSPETTYFIAMMILVAVALVSYTVSALLTKSWHPISRVELVSYSAFCLAVVFSSIFSNDARSSFFGEGLTSASGVSLITLPVIMFLVRTLPEALRRKLKYTFIIILGLASFVFVLGFMFEGKMATVANQLFSGFSSPASFAVYLGLFTLACFFFIKKAVIPLRYKIVIATTAIIFVSWIVSFATQDSVRPDFTSTISVGKSVLVHDGPFGIGAGNFNRAWQLYRPSSVITSPYFGHEFNQGSAAMPTIFVNVGIVGLFFFLLLVLSALYSSYVNYRKAQPGVDHFILGLITMTLLYFACISWVSPLSYATLVVWMVMSGLAISRTELGERHSSKKIYFLMLPIAVLLIVNIYFVIQKTRAFVLYGRAQTLSSAEEALTTIAKASSIYPFDGFYRAQVEYTIQLNRSLVATANLSPEELQSRYLEKTKIAIESALLAIKFNPDNYQNYVSLGRAYELVIPFKKESGYANAKESYKKAVKLYPENPYLYIMLARLEASVGNKEGVRAELAEILKKKQNFADALYLMSQLEASDQKTDEALMYALEAVKSAPNDPLAHFQVGLLYLGKKDYQNSVTSLQLALQRDPNNANVAYFLALALRDGGRPDIAKQIADNLIKQNPENPDLKTLLDSFNVTDPTSSSPVIIKATSTKSVIKK